MKEILKRHKVNIINMSVRHSKKDPGSMLAWAREEVFAFVIYYKQGVTQADQNKVAVWTRELIDSAIRCQGTYYLPYQLHATNDQFHKAYPKAKEFFTLKQKLDPENKFSNKLWQKYYDTNNSFTYSDGEIDSYFHKIYSNTMWRDKFFLFLQNIYNIYPPEKLHTLIINACKKYSTDKEIYEYIQHELPSITPSFFAIRYLLPSLKRQKQEIANQTTKILANNKVINGYVEIGSKGRYIRAIEKDIKINYPIYLIDDQEMSYSIEDVVERGQLSKIGTFVPLNNYNPIDKNLIPDQAVDIVTCYIGLHHAPHDRLNDFVNSIYRILKNGGSFIIRDHDADSKQMAAFLSLAHIVYNAGLGVGWKDNQSELHNFINIDTLTYYLQKRGFNRVGEYILQDHDPSNNTLMKFVKVG